LDLLFFRIISYLAFIFRSGNAHGLHSPFVFDLYTRCIANDRKEVEHSAIELKRKSFLQNQKEIQIRDFGAGSKSLGTHKRKIEDIAKISVSDPKKCRLLYRLSAYFKPESILELGTNLGISTAYLHAGYPQTIISSVEGDPELYELAAAHLNPNIELINDKFDVVLDRLASTAYHANMVFIDGDHKGSSLLRYVQKLKEMSGENSVFILDDIYWSKDMNKAWKKLVRDPYFGISIDLYHFGLLFPRKKQPKQHFRLRF
jgi:predicted O-methyltransferase YrrM